MSSLLAKARDKVSRHQDERRAGGRRSNDDEEEFGDPTERLGRINNNRTAATTSADYQLEINAADNNAALLLLDKKKQRTWSFRGDPEEAHYAQHHAPFSTLFALAQCIILTVMMIKCGIAPLRINPMIGPGPDVLDYWGAKNAYKILEDGETYRLFTPVFLHAGIIHLVGNVMVQIDAGNTWEKEWGSLIWLLVYVGSTLGSSIFSCCFMPNNISVGSSGAVMGLFGAKFAEITLLCCEKGKTRQERWANTMRNRQACQVIGGIIIVMAMSFIPFVDWAAHVGGVVAGFVIGIVCFSFQLGRRDSIVSWVFVALWFIVGLGGVIALYSCMLVYMYTEVEANPDLKDVCAYYQQFFDDYECNCQVGG
jgi:membrane associated rhomboid family serine protease